MSFIPPAIAYQEFEAIDFVTALREHVYPDCPGVPPGLANRRIRDSAIEFCRDSQVWTVRLDPITVRADVMEYELDEEDIPVCAEIIVPTQVLQQTTEEDDELNESPFPLGPNQEYTMNSRLVLRLRTRPADTIRRGLRVTVALRPKIGADDIEKQVFDEYYDFIAHGAKYKLMSIPRKGWSDPVAARFHYEEYRRGIREARIRIQRGLTNAELRVTTTAGFITGGSQQGARNRFLREL